MISGNAVISALTVAHEPELEALSNLDLIAAKIFGCSHFHVQKAVYQIGDWKMVVLDYYIDFHSPLNHKKSLYAENVLVMERFETGYI